MGRSTRRVLYKFGKLILDISLQRMPVSFGTVIIFLRLVGKYFKMCGICRTENWIMATF